MNVSIQKRKDNIDEEDNINFNLNQTKYRRAFIGPRDTIEEHIPFSRLLAIVGNNTSFIPNLSFGINSFNTEKLWIKQNNDFIKENNSLQSTRYGNTKTLYSGFNIKRYEKSYDASLGCNKGDTGKFTTKSRSLCSR